MFIKPKYTLGASSSKEKDASTTVGALARGGKTLSPEFETVPLSFADVNQLATAYVGNDEMQRIRDEAVREFVKELVEIARESGLDEDSEITPEQFQLLAARVMVNMANRILTDMALTGLE